MKAKYPLQGYYFMNNYSIHYFILGITLCLTGNFTFASVFKNKQKTNECITYEFDTTTGKNRTNCRLHILSTHKTIESDSKTAYIVDEKTDAKTASVSFLKKGKADAAGVAAADIISLSIPQDMSQLGFFHTYIALFNQINNHYNKIIIVLPSPQQFTEQEKNSLSEAMIRAFIAYRYANQCSFNDIIFVPAREKIKHENKSTHEMQEKLCDQYYATSVVSEKNTALPHIEKNRFHLIINKLKTIIKSPTARYIGIAAISIGCLLGVGAFLYSRKKITNI